MSYDTNNIFNKIINKEIPANIIYEDQWLMAFYDINPVSPLHILIIPKNHYISFADFTKKASNFEISHFFRKVNQIAQQAQAVDQFRLISNNGADVGQTVFHFHVHIIGQIKISKLI